MRAPRITDAAIRWVFFLAYAATALLLWAFKPSALVHFGASLFALPTDMTPAAAANYSLLIGLLITASPFAALEVVVLLYRHRNEFGDAASDIRLHRPLIARDLAKISISFLLAAALGAIGLYSLAQKPALLAESFLSFFVALVICYMLIASIIEMIKYLPIVRHVLPEHQ
jgi:hypothetical protein